jgi:translation initiation factor 1
MVWDDDRGGSQPHARRRDGQKAAPKRPPVDEFVRIRRETGGRGGKTVTTIFGLDMAPPQIEELARELKKKLGVGGAVDGFTVVIQGDHRDRIEAWLVERGMKVKRAGG